MKVHKRSLPTDTLSFEHKGCHVSVFTNRNLIRISVYVDDHEVRYDLVTPEQFIALLTTRPTAK